jgi:putative transcriptional regulator
MLIAYVCVFLNLPVYHKKLWKGFINFCGSYSNEVVLMIKSRIGVLLRVSKYRREFIQKELGVSANTLTNWCTGKTYPPIDKAFILADLLNVKVEDLYERSDSN